MLCQTLCVYNSTLIATRLGEMSARMCPSIMAMADSAGLSEPMNVMFTIQEMLMGMVTKLPGTYISKLSQICLSCSSLYQLNSIEHTQVTYMPSTY